MFKIDRVIRGGLACDGTGSKSYQANVLIGAQLPQQVS